MSTQHQTLWQAGTTDAPLPPLVDPQLLRQPQRRFVAAYRQYGPIFRVPHAEKPMVVLAGPEANIFVTRQGGEFFTTREHWEGFTEAMEIENWSNARDGQANRVRRAQVGRSYSRARILDQVDRMVEITGEYANWSPEQCVTVLPAMQRIVAEQLGQLLVHYSPGDYLADLIKYLNTNIVASLQGNKQAQEIQHASEYIRAKERTYELGRKILQAHREDNITVPTNGKPDMIDEALAAAAQHPGQVPEAALARMGIGPLLAGVDTVANTSSFLLYALLTHSDILERVQREVDGAFAQGPLTWEQLKNMPNLYGTIMETLRYYPVAGGHMLRAAQPGTFAGYRIEPGDNVFIAMTVPHFLEEYYPEPEHFDIDRYHAPRDEHRQPGTFAPFGLGDHICLGAGIAEVQLMVIAAALLHRYQFALNPLDYTLTIEHDPTPSPGQHFQIKIVSMR